MRLSLDHQDRPRGPGPAPAGTRTHQLSKITNRHETLPRKAQWARLAPWRRCCPGARSWDVPPIGERRQLIDGIRFRTRTGLPWRDVPERYGPWGRVYDLFRRWQRDGTWRRIFIELQAQVDAEELISRDINVDSTMCRAHQHAAGARKKRGPSEGAVRRRRHRAGRPRPRTLSRRPDDQAASGCRPEADVDRDRCRAAGGLSTVLRPSLRWARFADCVHVVAWGGSGVLCGVVAGSGDLQGRGGSHGSTTWPAPRGVRLWRQGRAAGEPS
ncbi:transposase [Streptomyces sp. NPDC002012]|uniref:transposase n=1 Tax=Streptomyces sp. NPDC002012 TaxID=3154532 RepID=UPI003318E510